jgi:hypothetical protein
MKLFGFEIKRNDDDINNQPISFAEPLNDDGALTVGAAVGGSYGMLLDLEGSAKSEAELVTRYRSLTVNPEIQQAVDEIVNEVISIDSHDKVVNIILDDLKVADKVKEKITEEFQNVLRLLDFSNNGYDIFSKFYIDGRLNYHAIIDEKNLKKGIVELRYLDPRKIRLIREMVSEPLKNQGANVTVKKIRKEYYMYSENGFGASKVTDFSGSIQGLKIAKDSVIRITSGILNENNSVILSHLHKSIKSLNQLRILEDATVIYTMTRAPERRIFYVDVGNLPKAKAEQYLYDMMARHKNRVTYDPSSGEIRDDRKMMTMTEDYWFPRREGNRSTEVTTLAAGTGLGEDRNLPYFQSKLYKSLNVPIARLQPETMYSFGRMSEVTREELKFAKFVKRLRTRFSVIFDKCLERQLVLKGIITPDEWKEMKNVIRYDFMKDNYFEELKEAEILREKISTLRDIEEHVGKYFSREWITKNVLYMTDEEIKEMQKQIKQEAAQEEPIPGEDEPDTNAPPEQEAPQPTNDADESLTVINRRTSKPQKRILR